MPCTYLLSHKSTTGPPKTWQWWHYTGLFFHLLECQQTQQCLVIFLFNSTVQRLFYDITHWYYPFLALGVYRPSLAAKLLTLLNNQKWMCRKYLTFLGTSLSTLWLGKNLLFDFLFFGQDSWFIPEAVIGGKICIQ